MDDEDDPTRHYHKGHPTSIEAHESIIEFKTRLHCMVLDYGALCGDRGMTCDEAEIALGLSHQSCSARFTELKAAGALVWGERRRPTRSGRNADVWIRRGSVK